MVKTRMMVKNNEVDEGSEDENGEGSEGNLLLNTYRLAFLVDD